MTGVSRRVGIGHAIAKRLLDDGAAVVTTGFAPHDEEMPWDTDAGGAAQALAEHPAAERWYELPPEDLSDPEVPERLVTGAMDRFGGLDVLIANHARSSHDGLDDVTVEELDACWAINARASLLLARSLKRRRAAGPGGRLVLFTSGQHIGPMSNEIAYAVSKGAIHQMTASLSDALIDAGITVNCINPGPTDTGYATGAFEQKIAGMFPGGRWGRPEDVANLVSWLASDESAWITGQIIDSEGGFRRWS